VNTSKKRYGIGLWEWLACPLFEERQGFSLPFLFTKSPSGNGRAFQ